MSIQDPFTFAGKAVDSLNKGVLSMAGNLNKTVLGSMNNIFSSFGLPPIGKIGGFGGLGQAPLTFSAPRLPSLDTVGQNLANVGRTAPTTTKNPNAEEF